MTSLTSLLQRTTIEDHEEVLQSSNAALAKSKSDLYAQHVKVVALLKLDRYEHSLRVFEESGDALKRRASLEYAYALYKCGQLEKAVDVVARVGDGRGAKHLEAQAVCIVFLLSCTIMTKFVLYLRNIALRTSTAPQRSTRRCLTTRKGWVTKKMIFASTPGPQMRNCSGKDIRNLFAMLGL